MILRRLGNKKKLAPKIIREFPKHTIYMEPFFGGGSIFFAKQLVPCNYLNDLDEDVFNLFNVVIHKKNELIEAFRIMPVHDSLLKYWKNTPETTDVLRALRFIFLSNFTLYGRGRTLRLSNGNSKLVLLELIQKTYEKIQDANFVNIDFRKFFKMFSIGTAAQKNVFVYCDPPYLGSTDVYSANFTEQDSLDLFDTLTETGYRWAMSEFDSPFILEQARQRKLNIISIGERTNIKNRRHEILITNYKRVEGFFDYTGIKGFKND